MRHFFAMRIIRIRIIRIYAYMHIYVQQGAVYKAHQDRSASSSQLGVRHPPGQAAGHSSAVSGVF